MFRVPAGRHGHGLRLPLAFIDPILRKVRPHCFDFLANEERLVPVYTRIAEHLARRYGYWCERSGHAFRFYRIEQKAA